MMNTIVRHIVIITIILPKHSLVWKLLEGSQNSVFNIKGKSKLNLRMGVVAWVSPVLFQINIFYYCHIIQLKTMTYLKKYHNI